MKRLFDIPFDIALWLSNLLWVPESTRFFFFLGFAALIWLDIIALIGGAGLWILYLIFS